MKKVGLGIETRACSYLDGFIVMPGCEETVTNVQTLCETAKYFSTNYW